VRLRRGREGGVGENWWATQNMFSEIISSNLTMPIVTLATPPPLGAPTGSRAVAKLESRLPSTVCAPLAPWSSWRGGSRRRSRVALLCLHGYAVHRRNAYLLVAAFLLFLQRRAASGSARAMLT
jgi:hypothetical protein